MAKTNYLCIKKGENGITWEFMCGLLGKKIKVFLVDGMEITGILFAFDQKCNLILSGKAIRKYPIKSISKKSCFLIKGDYIFFLKN
mmetsp:Transcript_30496/g.47775  ORF Transcript_30496/g.47775 Transcript_30496/m.47775 type:complete len:86 (-) Transcript_30496:800-1057(-)